MYTTFFYSSVDRHLSHFHFLAIGNRVAMNADFSFPDYELKMGVLLKIFNFTTLYLFSNVLIYTMYADTHRDQKYECPETGLLVVVNCHVGSGNQTLAFCKSSKCS